LETERTLLEGIPLTLTIERLCYQLIERHSEFENSCIVAIQPRGTIFAERLYQTLQTILPDVKIPFGKMDVTFYRDDFRMHETPLKAHTNDMPFILTQKRVVLIDDVLYSGRTTRAALDALQHYGRPSQVEFLTLVDRRFNRSLPIRPDYVGITVDALNEAYIKVEWEHLHGQDRILFFNNKA
jgi:pyrimidine operon attenuation protein / uracil phosphoribosyltransferase